MDIVVIETIVVDGRRFIADPGLVYVPQRRDGFASVEDENLGIDAHATSTVLLKEEVEEEFRFRIKEYMLADPSTLAEDGLEIKSALLKIFHEVPNG